MRVGSMRQKGTINRGKARVQYVPGPMLAFWRSHLSILERSWGPALLGEKIDTRPHPSPHLSTSPSCTRHTGALAAERRERNLLQVWG